jgi:hypothetical protein
VFVVALLIVRGDTLGIETHVSGAQRVSVVRSVYVVERGTSWSGVES